MTNLKKEDPLKQEVETKLPNFSIVFETENLSSVELENIYRSLASLEGQDISLEQANEFLIVDGGYAPNEVIEELCSKYPWITVHRASGISYYEAKMLGASLATGEIIVYADSDCVYVPNWLRIILSTFSQNPDINVVAGETSTPVNNFYDLAIALHYFFPRFSARKHLYESKSYFLNNVAFRRDFLLRNPIPTNLPLYRGNCGVHAHTICNLKGYKIWKHPKAMATHEPPTVSFSFWRYILLGSDFVMKKTINSHMIENCDINHDYQLSLDLNFTPSEKIRGIASAILRARPFKPKRINAVLQEEPLRLVLFPMAVPIMLWFELLCTIGRVRAYLKPDWSLKRYRKVLHDSVI